MGPERVEAEQPVGIVVSLGGQTPLKLANDLPPELVAGTSPTSIDLAEDREQWNALCARLDIPQPPGATATSTDEALSVIGDIGYPALVRPSYVLGGRAMEIVYDDEGLRAAMEQLTSFGGSVPKIALHGTNNPSLIGQYASNGCIRVRNEIIQQIRGLVTPGSKVIITT